MAIGERNYYKCETCGKGIITIDSNNGTTPMMIRCRVTPSCKGMMMSSWYMNVPEGKALWEWRLPTKAEYRNSTSAMQDHFDMGGLALYPVTGDSRYQGEQTDADKR